MKYSDVGFRAIYHNFCAIPLKANYKIAAKDFPDGDKSKYLLGYGYIDNEAGMTIEVIAAGNKVRGRFRFSETNLSVRGTIRIGEIGDSEIFLINDEDNSLKNRYAEKLEVLSFYDDSEEIKESRNMRFLDPSRHPHFPDDIQVYLMKDGLGIEGCWARIYGLADHWIMAKLLNEPNQNFGYHEGDKIAVFVQELENGKIICYSNMNPSHKLTAEDLEDGSLLKEAVIKFNKEQTERNFIAVLELLRDSYVWIPCNTIISDADQKYIEELVDKAGDNLDDLIGQTAQVQDNIRLVPDILQSEDEFYFPVFSSVEEMGEYGEHFSKVQKHTLEAIILAKNNDKNLSGIVLNAFSEPFVLEKEIFDIVEEMKSSLE